MYHPILRPRAQQQLKKVGEADLVIGVPTYRNTRLATKTVQAALDGADHYYPHLRTVLVNADAGKSAATRQAVGRLNPEASEMANGRRCAVISGRYEGLLGRGSAVASLLDAALALDAKAIVILDSHAGGVSPEWVAALGHLILENKVDLVLPRYQRWISPASLFSDLIVFPLFRALWGQSLRHPAAPDFALSPRLATTLLDEDVWETAVATDGLMPWLTSYAAVGPWRIAQAALGSKNSHAAVDAGSFGRAQVVEFQNLMTVLFRQPYRFKNHWQLEAEIRSLPTLTRFAHPLEPLPAPQLDIAPLLDALALGWIEYRSLWGQVLTDNNLAQIELLATLPPDQFYFPSDLWARVIYDFVVWFNLGDVDPDRIVTALYPLYLARLAGFWQEIAGLAPVGCEGTVAAQAVEFEETRHYLQQRWQSRQGPRRANLDQWP